VRGRLLASGAEAVREQDKPPAAAECSEADALDDLAEEITTLFAHVHAATHRLLTLIAEFDQRRGWEPGGFRSCADWLAFCTGIDKGAAREKVRAARALTALPLTDASMSRGELSFAKVRALTRVATAENEGELLDYARQVTAAELERLVRGWRLLSRADEQELERARHRSRRFSVFPDYDGMYVVKGRLDPEVGALLMRAVEAASDALFGRERRSGRENLDGRKDARDLAVAAGLAEPRALETTPKQRRADALGLLAERALAVGFGGHGAESGGSRRVPEHELEAHGRPRSEDREERVAERPHVADGVGPQAPPRPRAPISGSRAERYQVVLHVDSSTLSERGAARGLEHGMPGGTACSGRGDRVRSAHGVPGWSEHGDPDRSEPEDGTRGSEAGKPGRSQLEDGTCVSAETSRRLACDASRIRLTRGAGGAVLDVGRKTRTIPPAIRRALEVRDRGCRFPGCGLRFTDAHHVRHWADGGPTRLDNLVLLCRRHHRAVHEEGFRVEMPPGGRPNFYDPRGLPLPDAPPLARLGMSPVQWLIRQNRLRGVRPTSLTAGTTWRRHSDIPWELEARAREALDPNG
jgi:hypothetical protein